MTIDARPGWARLAGGSLALAVVRVGGMGCGLLLMVFLARTLPPAQLGAVTLCFSVAMIGGLLVSLNVGAGAVRFVNAYLEARRPDVLTGYHRFGQRTVFATASVLWGALALLGTLGFLTGRALVPTPVLIGLIAAPLFAWLRIAAANVAATGAVLRGAVPATLLRPLLLLLSVIAVYLGAGQLDAHAVFGAYLATVVLVVVLQWPVFRPVLAPLARRGAIVPAGEPGRWRRVGLDLLVPALFLELFVDIVVLFAALVVDDAALAALGIVLRLQGIVLFLVTSINMTLSPRIAAAHSAADRTEVDRLLLISTHLKLWPSLLALAALAVLGRWVLGLFATAYTPYLLPLLILATTPLIMALAGPVVLFVTILGLEQAARRVFAWALALLLVLVTALGRRYGLDGIAVAVVLVWLFWHARLYWIIRRDSGYSTLRLAAG